MIRMDTPILGPHLLAAIRAVLTAYKQPHYTDDDWEAEQVAYIRTAAQIDGLGLLTYAEAEQAILTARAICLAQGCGEDVDLPEQTNRAIWTMPLGWMGWMWARSVWGR